MNAKWHESGTTGAAGGHLAYSGVMQTPEAELPEAEIDGRPATLTANDGRALAARWFEPVGPAHAVAVVSAAGGVPQGYYRAFAQWLAARGYAVLTYDYRGIGASRQGPLRDDPSRMADWALLDMSAALAAAAARAGKGGPLPLLMVGHSFGGNCAAFAHGVQRADAILMVASGTGEPRLYPWPQRALLSFFFRLWLPALLPLFGHLPGWALGPGAQPLPAGAARQWVRWGLRRGWAFADPEMAAHSAAATLSAPLHLWSIDDDRSYAPRRAVDALAAHFTHAAVQRHHLLPADAALRQLGHFGVFRRQAGAPLWLRLMQPLEAAVPALQPPAHQGKAARTAAAGAGYSAPP